MKWPCTLTEGGRECVRVRGTPRCPQEQGKCVSEGREIVRQGALSVRQILAIEERREARRQALRRALLGETSGSW